MDINPLIKDNLQAQLAEDDSIKGTSASPKHQSRAGFIWFICGRGRAAFGTQRCLVSGRSSGVRYIFGSI